LVFSSTGEWRRGKNSVDCAESRNLCELRLRREESLIKKKLRTFHIANRKLQTEFLLFYVAHLMLV
jgi:hypothetical protein